MTKYVNKRAKSKSPLTAAPHRQAGQSVEEERLRILDDEVLVYIMVSIIFLSVAVMEWVLWFSKTPPQPWLISLIALIVLGYSIYKIFRAKRKLVLLRQARDGERAVGEFLETLRENGFKVLHDIVGDSFNVDHLLIGPNGIYTVETKTWSKPLRGEAIIAYDGEKVLLNGFEPDRNPVIQAKAQAHWIKQLLFELTGQNLFVQPVVVFPGWFVKPLGSGKRPEVWVLNPKALPTFLANEKIVLSEEQVRSTHAHLSRYARNTPS